MGRRFWGPAPKPPEFNRQEEVGTKRVQRGYTRRADGPMRGA